MLNRFKKVVSAALSSTMILGTMSVMPSGTASAAVNCTIDTSKQYQTIRGFGGINHPEWAGDLTESQRKTAFGNSADELGLTILRVFVNPDSSQWSRAVPTAKYASDLGVTVFASPWEPPSNLTESGGSNGKLHLPKSNYAAYAKHLNDFGTYMKDNKVDLYAISVQNEPDYASEWTYWSTDETTDFIANYGDKITSTKLMSPESFQYAPENASWVKDGGKKFYKKILNNAKAMANCDVFGTHMYGTQRSWMDFTELENSGKEIWMTEVYVPNSDKDSANRFPEALDVSENIHNAMVVGNMSAYTWWYIRRNYGLMTEDGKISKRGYCMAQYSKYVRPGAVRVEATEQPTKDVYVSAYKNKDGSIAIVAINKSDESYAQSFSVGQNIKNVDRYRTSANENIAETKNLESKNDGFFAQLPANSVSTFVVTVDGSAVTPTETTEPEKNVEPDKDGYYFHDTFEESNCNWKPHGTSEIALSGRVPYKGTDALLVQNRDKSWCGVEKALDSKAFKAGSEYSFSVCLNYVDGDSPKNAALSLQYKNSSGETKYARIASASAVKGHYVQLANKSFKLPEGGSNFVIYVETENDNDDFYIDEAIGAVKGISVEGPPVVVETTAATTTQPTVTTVTTTKPIETSIIGDVNSDKQFNIADVVLMQKWIIKTSDIKLANWKAGDIDENGKINVIDLALMKEKLLNSSTSTVSLADYVKTVQSRISEFDASGATDEKTGVNYGTFEKVSFKSDVCGGRTKSMNVLLPANYDKNKKYPVLYALHGYWGNEDSLLDAGDSTIKFRQVLGNAIASGEAEEMIVVFPNIYASATQDNCDGLNDKNNKAYDNFINELTKEVMPYIEKNYSVKTGRENTAITGFSMGGRESLYIGFSRPDVFGYVGAVCPAPGLTTDLIKEADLKFGDIQPQLVMISAGTNDEVVYSTPEGYHNTLNKNGVPHVWHTVTDGGHWGSTIRPHIYNYVRNIFKNN